MDSAASSTVRKYLDRLDDYPNLSCAQVMRTASHRANDAPSELRAKREFKRKLSAVYFLQNCMLGVVMP
jgi:hypothetical protein